MSAVGFTLPSSRTASRSGQKGSVFYFRIPGVGIEPGRALSRLEGPSGAEFTVLDGDSLRDVPEPLDGTEDRRWC